MINFESSCVTNEAFTFVNSPNPKRGRTEERATRGEDASMLINVARGGFYCEGVTALA